MDLKFQNEIKAGIFIFIGLVLMMAMVLILGGSDIFFERHFPLKAKFNEVSGLSEGAKVQSGGIRIGRIYKINYDEEYDGIIITMQIKEKYRKRIKEDSQVEMQTLGVLGDKYLEIKPGTSATEIVKNNYVLESEPVGGLSAMLKEGQSVVKLMEESLKNIKTITDSFAADKNSEKFFTNLAESSRNLNSILLTVKNGQGIHDLNSALKNVKILTERINNGQGTIGLLLNDPTLYEDVKMLIGGANRNKILKFFVRQAVKSSDDNSKDEVESTTQP